MPTGNHFTSKLKNHKGHRGNSEERQFSVFYNRTRPFASISPLLMRVLDIGKPSSAST